MEPTFVDSSLSQYNLLVVCTAGYFIVVTCIASFTRSTMNGRHQLQWQQHIVIHLSTYS